MAFAPTPKEFDLNPILIAWVVSLLVSISRPGAPIFYPDAKETEAETQARYALIAQDVLKVTQDPQEDPLFEGPTARVKTAAVILSVAAFESHFRKDVDLGLGKYSRGDSGRSWCLNQINLGVAGPEGKTFGRFVPMANGSFRITYNEGYVGWGGEDLVADRTKCSRAALAIARRSFKCGGPALTRLKWYASGRCELGDRASSDRMGLALRWISKIPADLEVSSTSVDNPLKFSGL